MTSLLQTIAADSHFSRINGYSRLPVQSFAFTTGHRTYPFTMIDRSWTLDRFGRWNRGAVDVLLPRD